MTHTLQNQKQNQKLPAQASSKASFKSKAGETGYICKRCEGAAPVGIGYVISNWCGVPDESRTACDCGYSEKPETEGDNYMIFENGELFVANNLMEGTRNIENFVADIAKEPHHAAKFTGCPNYAEFRLLDAAVQERIIDEAGSAYRADLAIAKVLSFIRKNREELTDNFKSNRF